MSKSAPAELDEEGLLREAGSEKNLLVIQASERGFYSKHLPPLEVRDVFGLLVEGVCVHLEHARLVRSRLRFDDLSLIQDAACSAVLLACPELGHRAFVPAGFLLPPLALAETVAAGHVEWRSSRERMYREIQRTGVLPGFETREGRIYRVWYLMRRKRWASVAVLEQDIRAGVAGTEHAVNPRALLAGLATSPDLFCKVVWVDDEGLFRINKWRLMKLLGEQPPRRVDALARASNSPLECEPDDLRAITEPGCDPITLCRQVEEVRRTRAKRVKAGSVRGLVLEHLSALLSEDVTQADFAREHDLDPGQLSRLLKAERASIAREVETGTSGE